VLMNTDLSMAIGNGFIAKSMGGSRTQLVLKDTGLWHSKFSQRCPPSATAEWSGNREAIADSIATVISSTVYSIFGDCSAHPELFDLSLESQWTTTRT
jgi:hypothetical protein